MRQLTIITMLVLALSIQIQADIPKTMSYQGKLTDASGSVDGKHELTFRIYDVAEGGTALWTETHPAVVVTDGIFSVILGSVTPIESSSLSFATQYWLGIAVNSGSELTPRMQLTSAPYALGGNFWKLSGNDGTIPGIHFLGTTDLQTLELHVNGLRALRLEPDERSPNVIGGSRINSVTPGIYGATIAGGGSQSGMLLNPNRVTDNYGTVGGGLNNTAGDDVDKTSDAICAAVGGGSGNEAYSKCSTVGGGSYNRAIGEYATVSGGLHNEAMGDYATIGGGGPINTNPATANRVTDKFGTVGGGGFNQAGNGNTDTTDARFATVAGGYNNKATGDYATVAGGHKNEATARTATVSGGDDNNATGDYATIGGGYENDATAECATVAGGKSNDATARYATVAGGYGSRASGEFSFAAGRGAKAEHDGCFVWGDSTDASVETDDSNQFVVRASGGVWFGATSSPSIPAGRFLNTSTGGYLSTTGKWMDSSDRALKENFVPADGREILDHLASMPVSIWNYRIQSPDTRHIGPVAQDFYATFHVGDDDRHISPGDTSGVALAAIQGLYEIVKEKDAKIAHQEQRIDDLEARLKALEALLGDE